MDITNQVSYKILPIFSSNTNEETKFCRQLHKLFSSICYCHYQGFYIYINISSDCVRRGKEKGRIRLRKQVGVDASII